MATLPTTITITTSTTASAQMKPIVTHRPPMATRSPMKRDSCVVEPPFCPSCLSKLSSSEPWFPYPPPLFIPNACSRCGTLQVILNRLPEEVTVFSDILKLASFGEIVDFNELLNDADGQMTLLAPSDAAFTYLPVSVDDLKQRLVRSPNEMRRFVLYHLLPGYVTSRDFKPNAWIATCLFDKSIYVNTDKFASWYRMFARVPKHDMVTVFAPTNAAFERIAPSIRKNLAKNDVLKARSVQKHIVPGLWFSSSMPSSGTVLTPMDGVSVTCMTVKYEFDDSHKRNKYQPQIALYTADKVLTFGSSRVIASDQFATNGVIHIVDKLHTDQLELCGFS
ncbi:embryo cathepsin L-associated protein-like [Tropilaelaps mercedesae]|uniref:Embryo cathepsin L-associated protein-like n=1 Tax=Tropilaelaps mercedesae TaxID=418985 RepID=A0A1V9X732_9ACAR|nr:embryo cathepsin L-associated protein-like [Tropilaelaps mercedesae]